MDKPNINELKKYEPLYIIGHSHIDVDSAVSSKIFSEILNFFGVTSFYAILDKEYIFDDFNKRMINDCMSFKPRVISQNDICKHNFFLVDHNDRSQSIGMDASVVGALDHHPKANNVRNIILGDTCSISLYLYKIYKDKYSFTKEQKYQIFMAFLSDSRFGMSSRCKDSDILLANELGFGNNYENLFKKYFIPTNISNGIASALYNGNKKYQFGNVVFESGYIEAFGNEKIEEYKNLIKKQNSFLGIWWDYKNKRTHAYFSYKGDLLEKKYDYIASRSETILKDILNYLKITID